MESVCEVLIHREKLSTVVLFLQYFKYPPSLISETSLSFTYFYIF
jgi:hypothetical protein